MERLQFIGNSSFLLAGTLFYKIGNGMWMVNAIELRLSIGRLVAPSPNELNIRYYDITQYALENIHSKINSQEQGFMELTELNKDTSNYNVDKILNEARLYLQKTT